jgi:hypothetical protein
MRLEAAGDHGENKRMSDQNLPENQPLLRLSENLKELEVVLGAQARGVIEQVRSGLLQAIATRSRGDLRGAIDQIRAAMEKLAALGSSLDAEEGLMMREVAARFVSALGSGDKDAAKETVNLMRHKAGDPKDDDHGDW